MPNEKSNFKEYKRKGETGGDKPFKKSGTGFKKAGGSSFDKKDNARPARKRTTLKNENDEPIKKSVVRSQKNSTGKSFEERTGGSKFEKQPYEKKEHDRPFKRNVKGAGEDRSNTSSDWKKPFP